MEKYLVYRGYTAQEPFAEYYSMDQVTALVHNYAAQYNYGLYRSWTIDGTDYYDCGAIVLMVKKLIKFDFSPQL